MLPIPATSLPAALTANQAIPSDAINDEIIANRTAVLLSVAELNGLHTRVLALEAKVTTPVPPSVVYVDITAAQETALTAVGVGSLVVLRGPAGPAGQTTIILERKP